MTRQEKEINGKELARKDFTEEKISKLIKELNITSVKYTLGYYGLYSKNRFRAYNDNASKYKNRPVFLVETQPNITNWAYMKEVYKLFLDSLQN